MISDSTRSKYKLSIGIECHVQLKTKTKLFSGANNDAREAPPNTLVNHIDFGLPGALPVLNKQAIYLAVKAAYALDAKPQAFSKFDRKHYFYPDLPMGYQITQYDEPIILDGQVEIEVNNETKVIGITRAHLEADAGKSVHPTSQDYSLVDLNRAGTPLLEIVSEPDMHSSAEAKAYARELYLRMRYAEVSDANLFYGNMRFDVNVSVSASGELGTRTETKNLNSFRSVEKAVEYEANRQIALLQKGESIIQETRGWDDAKQKTFSQRTKENADDYRYMPDPDLPPVVLDEDYTKAIKAKMPIMPKVWRARLAALKLEPSQIETIIEAEVEDEVTKYLELIEAQANQPNFAKFIANWFVNLEIPLKRDSQNQIKLTNEARASFYQSVWELVEANKLSSTNVKVLLSDLLSTSDSPDNIEQYANQKGLIQVSDEAAIKTIVTEVIKANPGAVKDVQSGEMKAIGFLVGQVMKESKGKANPSLAQTLIKQQLEL